MKLGKLFGIALGLLLATGCGASLKFTGWEPGDVSVGNSNRLVITDAEGRRSAREFTVIDLGKQASSMGYFQTDDRSESVKMEITGREVSIEGGEGIGETDLYVRMDIIDWDADKDEITKKGKDGAPIEVKVYVGEVLLQVTLSDENNRAILAEKEYKGGSQIEVKKGEKGEAIERAATNAVHSLLVDITPHKVWHTVKLDSSDKGIKDYLKGARKGAVKQSLDDIAAYVKNNPNSPAAQFALAVMYDATGDYETALVEYDKAIALGGKPWYGTARSGCAARKTAAAELTK